MKDFFFFCFVFFVEKGIHCQRFAKCDNVVELNKEKIISQRIGNFPEIIINLLPDQY